MPQLPIPVILPLVMSDARPPIDNFSGLLAKPGQALVLIVEEYEDSRKMLKVLLGLKGYSVIEAEDGEHGLALAQDKHPDLILMNIGLSVLHDLATYRQMRDCPSLGDVPIILMSCFSTDGFQEEVRSAGCQELLAKPLDFDQLEYLLESYLSH